jgi:hypothetical protein
MKIGQNLFEFPLKIFFLPLSIDIPFYMKVMPVRPAHTGGDL